MSSPAFGVWLASLALSGDQVPTPTVAPLHRIIETLRRSLDNVLVERAAGENSKRARPRPQITHVDISVGVEESVEFAAPRGKITRMNTH